jgi:hypothetical protein
MTPEEREVYNRQGAERKALHRKLRREIAELRKELLFGDNAPSASDRFLAAVSKLTGGGRP